jgi:hypothetical protein
VDANIFLGAEFLPSPDDFGCAKFLPYAKDFECAKFLPSAKDFADAKFLASAKDFKGANVFRYANVLYIFLYIFLHSYTVCTNNFIDANV